MAELNLNMNISLVTERCYECGRWFALEYGWSGKCPYCAARKIGNARSERDALERVVRAQRGAITRMRRRRV